MSLKTFTLAWVPYSLMAVPRVLEYIARLGSAPIVFEPKINKKTGLAFYEGIPEEYARRILSRQMDRFFLIGKDEEIYLRIPNGQFGDRHIKLEGTNFSSVAAIRDKKIEALKKAAARKEAEIMANAKAQVSGVGGIDVHQAEVIKGGVGLIEVDEGDEEPKELTPQQKAAETRRKNAEARKAAEEAAASAEQEIMEAGEDDLLDLEVSGEDDDLDIGPEQ